jgi:hypothetical protein
MSGGINDGCYAAFLCALQFTSYGGKSQTVIKIKGTA